jgi:ribosomal protein L20
LPAITSDDLLAHPLRPVSNRTRVLRPANRQQFVQQRRDLAERRQRRISGRNVGQLWCNRIMAEIQNAEALHLNRVLTGTDKQASDAHRYIAEQ